MSMSTHVCGFRAADEQWNKMLRIYNACNEAGIKIPEEVANFFNYENPTDKLGMEVSIESAITGYQSDWQSGYDVDITKLPPGVKIVRFFNSW